jgi:hypothetical protein
VLLVTLACLARPESGLARASALSGAGGGDAVQDEVDQVADDGTVDGFAGEEQPDVKAAQKRLGGELRGVVMNAAA